MILRFAGKVIMGDYCRVDADDLENGSVHIGGRDVVSEVEDADFRGPVTVGIADERFAGELAVETGWGYSEYTPVDPDMLYVGEHDLLTVLDRYEGKEVTLWIADEAVNLLG